MGVSIDIHVYDYDSLVREITKAANENPDRPADRTVEDFIERVLPEFGMLAGENGDKWITLWNEYYEDYNAGCELFRAVELYFGLTDVYLGSYNWVGGANAHEVLEELDIEPIGDDEDE